MYTYSYKITISDNCSDIGTTPVGLAQNGSLQYVGLSAGVAESTDSRPLSSNGCINPVGPNIVLLPDGCPIVLPVKLLAFSAAATTGGNFIYWKAEEHYDVKKYTLQFSENGVTFSVLYTNDVAAREGTFNYNYTDLNKYNGTVYYRLAIIGTDGKVTYSNIVSVRKSGAVPEVNLSPNPATSDNVTLLSGVKVTKLQWYDVKGRLIKTTTNPVNGRPIAVNDLVPGVYFIKAYTNNGVSSLKLIKQ